MRGKGEEWKEELREGGGEKGVEGEGKASVWPELLTLTVPLLSTNHLLRSSMASALERELEGGEGRGQPAAM